jgi:hypothetical protein
MTSAPHAKSKQLLGEYKDRYVAFLDLLGFKEQVLKAETNPEERTKLHEVLALVRDTIGGNPYLGLRLTYFSDSMVVSADRTPPGLWEMLQSIFTVTFNLLQYDVLVRGGLTAGGAYHASDFLYGTAVNRATDVESQLARNPLTLVSSEVVEDAKGYSADHIKWLLEDGPQRYFVDYLRWYADYQPTPIYAGKVCLDDPGNRVMEFIRHRLNNDTGRVREKAAWFQTYWNRTVSVNGFFGRIEAGTTERYVSRGPTIMMRRMYMPNPPQKPPQK